MSDQVNQVVMIGCHGFRRRNSVFPADRGKQQLSTPAPGCRFESETGHRGERFD